MKTNAVFPKNICKPAAQLTAAEIEGCLDEINGKLKLPINFRLLPEAHSVSADLINRLRP